MSQVRRLSAGLARLGLGHQDYVVLCAPASTTWIIACFAVIDAGAVPVPIDAQMGPDELAHVLRDTAARWVFTDRNGERQLNRSGSGVRCEVILLEADDAARTWQRYLADRPADLPEVEASDTAVVFYTSGTTGMPKGVPLTHENVLSNLRALQELKLIAEGDRLLLPLPLHHAYPFTVGLLEPLNAGVPVVLPMSLTGAQVIRALTEAQITAIVSVPRFYAALYDGIETQLRQKGRLYLRIFHRLLRVSIFLSRRCRMHVGRFLFWPVHRRFAPVLRFVASGGAALDPELAWKLEGLGWRVASGYGLTETSPILTFNPPGEGIGTAGLPLPGVDVRIAEPEPGQKHGEVQARGPNVFSGYLHRPEETDNAFTKDGYFRTGDLGYFEGERLRLTGRASAMIVLSSGENLQPDQIEEALSTGPHVREAAVLEMDDRVVALIVPKATPNDDQDRLSDRIADDLRKQSEKLPSHHRITDFAVTRQPLPRTRLGKLKRHQLPALFDKAKRRNVADRDASEGPMALEQLSHEDRQLLDEPAARAVWKFLVARFPQAPLSPDTSIAGELRIDSMAWLNLSIEVEKAAGVDLTGDAIGRVETVRDLLREAVDARYAEGEAKDLHEKLRQPEKLLNEEQLRWLGTPSPAVHSLGQFLTVANQTVMQHYFRLKVHGSQHLPSAPFVLTPNHLSYLDAPALAAALPAEELSRTYWSGWTGVMFKNCCMRAVSRGTRVLPIDIGHNALSSLALAVYVLQRGFNLVWFPEGSISNDGELQPFQSGISFVLAAQNVSVVPVRIRGTREALPRENWWPKRRPLSVTFGAAIDSSGFLAGRDQQGPLELSNLLRERVAAL